MVCRVSNSNQKREREGEGEGGREGGRWQVQDGSHNKCQRQLMVSIVH